MSEFSIQLQDYVTTLDQYKEAYFYSIFAL